MSKYKVGGKATTDQPKSDNQLMFDGISHNTINSPIFKFVLTLVAGVFYLIYFACVGIKGHWMEDGKKK